MFELTDVSRRYDSGRKRVDALRDVNLTIADGELLAIQGPTGGGKTTLLQLLGGLDRPTRGSIEYGGRDLARLGEEELSDLRAREFGFVFQSFNLIPTLSALENVQLALVPLKLDRASRRARAHLALEQVDLEDRGDHLPAQLSGGQQQRVGIARALVKDPRVLLADEPTGNLDEDMRDEVIGVLERLWRERGLTLVIVTHDSAIARRAQRIAQIRKGQLSIRPGSTPASHKVPSVTG